MEEANMYDTATWNALQEKTHADENKMFELNNCRVYQSATT